MDTDHRPKLQKHGIGTSVIDFELLRKSHVDFSGPPERSSNQNLKMAALVKLDK